MNEQQGSPSALSGYRALDLTDAKGFFCGKLLGDLGTDVIKIEKPGGDPDRSRGPFYKDEPHPEKSLYWFAYNTNKRSITLDIEKTDGQELFRRLVKTADFVIESFSVGYMDKLGLGYDELSRVNPKVIMASITPFGLTGPYKDFKSSDIVVMAMSSLLYSTGYADRPPVWISFPHAFLLAAGEAAAGIMMALHHRRRMGEGQHISTSAQELLLDSTWDIPTWWFASKVVRCREGGCYSQPATGLVCRQQWPCKDGFVTFFFYGGMMGLAGNKALVEWMRSEGFATDYLKQIDWAKLDWARMTQEEVRRMEEPTARFFLSHTKKELYVGSVKRNIILYPVNDAKDILENEQLMARDYWVEVEHPELKTNIKYPGPFATLSETPWRIRRRAPLIGEHNSEVYGKELGLSKEEILNLKQARII